MAAAILDAARAYLAAGALVAVVFLVWGLGRIDPKARDAVAFRPLIAPGVALLWPLVLWRWRALARGAAAPAADRPPRRAQDAAALVLAAAIPVLLALGLAIRQDGPREREPVLLAPPEARP
jgi:uncharacterized membrane protein YphA (DoxX/SURF4 family)